MSVMRGAEGGKGTDPCHTRNKTKGELAWWDSGAGRAGCGLRAGGRAGRAGTHAIICSRDLVVPYDWVCGRLNVWRGFGWSWVAVSGLKRPAHPAQ